MENTDRNVKIKPSENNLVAFLLEKQKGHDIMCRCRMGNPKKSSRFICLSHLGINEIGNGIQRSNQREKGHIKDLYCLHCQAVTKNLEIRYCDSFDEMMVKAGKLHREYYGKVGC